MLQRFSFQTEDYLTHEDTYFEFLAEFQQALLVIHETISDRNRGKHTGQGIIQISTIVNF